MKKTVIDFIKNNWPLSECRYDGNNKIMYIHKAGIIVTPNSEAKNYVQEQIGEPIPFNIITQS
jgi:hypothetical protein